MLDFIGLTIADLLSTRSKNPHSAIKARLSNSLLEAYSTVHSAANEIGNKMRIVSGAILKEVCKQAKNQGK